MNPEDRAKLEKAAKDQENLSAKTDKTIAELNKLSEQMKKSAMAGNPPTRRSVFNDTELVARFPSYPAQLRSLETSKPRPRTPLWNEIENVFGIYLSRANSGELSAEDAMNQANAEISKIVERAR